MTDDHADDRAAGRFVFFIDPAGEPRLVDLGARAEEFRALAAAQQQAVPAPDPQQGPAAATVRRRRPLRSLAAVGTVAAVAATSLLVVGTGPAQSAAPVTKALQDVTISLSPQGRLTAVTTQEVLDSKGSFRTRSRTLAPEDAAAKVPVIASLGYVHEGRSGTDLSDLKGVSGAVEVDVTLTNVSTRSVALDTADGPRYAQVTTPFTVVGSARVPSSSYRRLVTSPTGRPAPDTTNGLVSRDGKSTLVQWASVLAPPRLPGSVTFRLVEDAKSFVLPDITLRVAPGLSADPSLAGSFDDAFAEDSPLLQLQRTTAALIDTVNAALNTVQTTLAGVRTELLKDSQQVGTNARSTINAIGSDAATRLDSVSGNLTSLRALLGQTITTAGMSGDQGLADALAQIVDTLGIPAQQPAQPAASGSPAPVTPVACSETDPTVSGKGTLWQQVQQVTGLLRHAAAVTAGCVGDLKQALLATIGSSTTCASNPGSLTCSLVAARTSFTADRNALRVSGSAILSDLQGTPLAGVSTAVSGAQAAVLKLQQDVGALSIASGANGGLGKALQTISDDVTALQALVDPANGAGFPAQLGSLHGLAGSARQALGDASDAVTADTTHGALNDLAAKVCALQAITGVPDLLTDADALRGLIDGSSCSDPTAAPSADTKTLASRLADDASAWDAVLTATDPTGKAGLGADLAALGSGLTTLRGHVDAVLALVQRDRPGKDNSTVGDLIDTVIADADGLYDAKVKDPVCSTSSTVPTDERALNAIERTFALVVCKKDDVQARLTSYLAATDAQDGLTAGALQDLVGRGDAARAAADSSVSDLLTRLSGSLTGAAAVEQGTTYDILSPAVSRLTADVAAVRERIRSLVSDSTRQLDTRIDGAVSANSDNSLVLRQGIQAVLDVLGTDSTPGLLRSVFLNGNKVGASGVVLVRDAASQATAFADVRATDSEALRLRAKQLEAGFESIRDLPFLGSGLPAAAGHTTLYTFHVAGGS